MPFNNNNWFKVSSTSNSLESVYNNLNQKQNQEKQNQEKQNQENKIKKNKIKKNKIKTHYLMK